MQKNLTCIICPRGCALTAEINGKRVSVTGHTCPKGEEYAVNECLSPVRTVTATVRISNRCDTMVSVKTAAPIPKGKIFEAMELIRSASVEAPVKIGDVILPDVFGTTVVATKDIG